MATLKTLHFLRKWSVRVHVSPPVVPHDRIVIDRYILIDLWLVIDSLFGVSVISFWNFKKACHGNFFLAAYTLLRSGVDWQGYPPTETAGTKSGAMAAEFEPPRLQYLPNLSQR